MHFCLRWWLHHCLFSNTVTLVSNNFVKHSRKRELMGHRKCKIQVDCLFFSYVLIEPGNSIKKLWFSSQFDYCFTKAFLKGEITTTQPIAVNLFIYSIKLHQTRQYRLFEMHKSVTLGVNMENWARQCYWIRFKDGTCLNNMTLRRISTSLRNYILSVC